MRKKDKWSWNEKERAQVAASLEETHDDFAFGSPVMAERAGRSRKLPKTLEHQQSLPLKMFCIHYTALQCDKPHRQNYYLWQEP